MKKTLIALAVLGTCAGAAYAQTNVTIYGTVDTGLIKETGSDVRMGSNEDSRIGFKGTEELGSGMKATFQLERRFSLNNGTKFSGNNALDILQGADPDGEDGVEWQGAANVGLQGEAWGAVRLGRVNDIAIENFGALDPFAYYGVGSAMGGYNILYSEELANTIRYDSPSWAGFGFNLSYTLGQDTHHGNGSDIFGGKGYDDYGNDGFGIGLKYDNGPLMLTANYDRLADSDKSWLWNAGGAYIYQGFKVSVGYQSTKVKSAAMNVLSGGDINADVDQKDWLVGLQYNTGPHTVKFSYNRGEVESHTEYDGKANKYSLGYTYDMSKRTSLYAMVAYTDSDNDSVGEIYNSNDVADDSVTGVQIGMTHRF
ncbi:porin [Oxalobacter aliiformigenes]|uniref:Porin n=1 Tax=Oxalobacter aliiformigenes TaxID=2946593 RepID=A0A9E9NTS0_9BURK|nr:porin [Oxalobacter aliiformigenes]WAV92068.1 porin [Oxalobacter aliiformigenes]